MGQSLLILHYGQSNADCHNAGPAFDAECLRDPRIVVPDDGYGFRGLAGRPRRKQIENFIPAHEDAPLVQSIGKAAAARYLLETPDTAYSQIIVRSSAKGGRPLCGYRKGDRLVDGIFLDADGDLSPLLTDMFEDVRQIVGVAEDMGEPITEVVIPFFHGEADRAADRSAYATVLMDMMNVVEEKFAEMGLQPHWLVTQPSGTSGGYAGNAWDSRMSVLDVCAERSNAHFVAANYAYELIDAAHLSGTGKALVGEILGQQIARVLHETSLEPTKVVSATMDEYWIDLTFDGPFGITLDDSHFPAPHVPHGFEIAGRSDQSVTSVEVLSNTELRIHCSQPLSTTQGQLQYAFSSNAGCKYNDESKFPFGRGSLCEDWAVPSAIVPDTVLRRWVPGFAIPLGEIAQKALAA